MAYKRLKTHNSVTAARQPHELKAEVSDSLMCDHSPHWPEGIRKANSFFIPSGDALPTRLTHFQCGRETMRDTGSQYTSYLALIFYSKYETTKS